MIENIVLADKDFTYYIYIQEHNENVSIMREMKSIIAKNLKTSMNNAL